MKAMLTKTNLYQEISEQPEAVDRFLQHEKATIDGLVAAMRERAIDHVVIAARGTSDNAGRYAQYVLGAFNQMQVALATPSLFSLYEQPVTFGNALVLGISQSGQSPDIVGVVAEARRQGRLTAVITNNGDSPLAQVGDFVINLHAGEEKAVAATKTYTSSLAAIACLSAQLADSAQMAAQLATIPAAMRLVLQSEQRAAEIAERMRYMQHCVVIGRGFNYSTAFELALKLKELTYSIVEPYSSADFQHGPFAVLNEGFPVIVIAPSGKLEAVTLEFIARLEERSAEVVVISDDEATINSADFAIPLAASVPEWLSPMTTIVPGQLLAMHLAHTRRFDVDAPRALSKVTKTS